MRRCWVLLLRLQGKVHGLIGLWMVTSRLAEANWRCWLASTLQNGRKKWQTGGQKYSNASIMQLEGSLEAQNVVVSRHKGAFEVLNAQGSHLEGGHQLQKLCDLWVLSRLRA